MRVTVFAAQGKAKPGAENVRGLNFVVVKLVIVQVTKLQLSHKMKEICMICFAKPGLIEGLYIHVL
jgi:hypothetical protein